MRFHVYSRSAIAHAVPPERPYIVISVTNSGDRTAARVPETDRCCGVLRLSFDDITRSMPDFPQFRAFSEDDARRILAFVEEHPEAEECLVHCQQGKRRSPAIAAAIAKILGAADSEFFRKYRPNILVYRTIVEAARRR